MQFLAQINSPKHCGRVSQECVISRCHEPCCPTKLRAETIIPVEFVCNAGVFFVCITLHAFGRKQYSKPKKVHVMIASRIVSGSPPPQKKNFWSSVRSRFWGLSLHSQIVFILLEAQNALCVCFFSVLFLVFSLKSTKCCVCFFSSRYFLLEFASFISEVCLILSFWCSVSSFLGLALVIIFSVLVSVLSVLRARFGCWWCASLPQKSAPTGPRRMVARIAWGWPRRMVTQRARGKFW